MKTLAYQLDAIGNVIVQTQNSDGLTWAKPDYQIKYLMDNCEAYRGLRDLASLFGAAFNDAGKQQYYPYKAPIIDAIVFNTRRPLFRNVDLRRAVSYALDRRALSAAFGAACCAARMQSIAASLSFFRRAAFANTAPRVRP